ncbi:MAG: hypothetical protein AAF266_08485, partial [Planctomycetota bacterium]
MKIHFFQSVLPLVLLAVGPLSSTHAQVLDPLDFASLGTLNLPAGNYTIDTDTLTIFDNAAPGVPLFTGVVDDQNGQADTFGGVWDPVASPGQLGIPEIAVFTFNGIDLQPSANVTITGTRAIALLSQGDATISTPLSVDGGPSGIDATGPRATYNGPPSLPSPGGFAGGTPSLGGGMPLFFNQPGDEGFFVPGDGPGAGDSVPKSSTGFGGFQGSGSFGGQGAPVSNSGDDPAPTYGDLTQTLQGGSGGGSSVATVLGPIRTAALTGGGGGGAIEIGAVGGLIINAEISARGGLVSDPPDVATSGFSSGGRAGGGSGGGIRVHGQRVTLDAPLVADGSVRTVGATTWEGGGGRIFVLNREADAEFEYVLGSATSPDPSYFDNLFARGTSLQDGDGRLTVTPALTVVPLGQTASFDSVSGQVPFSGPNGDYLVEFFVTNTRVLSGGHADIGAGFTNDYEIELAGPTASLIASGSLTNTNEITGTGRIEVPLTNAAGGELNAVSDTLVLTEPANNASGASINAIGSTLSFEAGLTNDGDLALINTTVEGAVANNGVVALAGTSTFTGTVTGSGNFLGGDTAAFTGTLAPGKSPGLVTFEGDLDLEATATLEIEIAGTTPGTEHDRIEVGGFAMLE